MNASTRCWSGSRRIIIRPLPKGHFDTARSRACFAGRPQPLRPLDAPAWVLRHQPEPDWIRRELDRLGLHNQAFATVDVHGDGVKQRLAGALEELGLSNEVHQPISDEHREQARASLRTDQGVDKLSVLLNVDRPSAERVMNATTFVVNREGRMKNINDADGVHLFSPRLRDGGLSMATAGAASLVETRTEPLPTTLPRTEWWGHGSKGPAVVVVDQDAEPFVRKGRNVFHGFVLGCDPWLAPGEACIITNANGNFLGHGVSQCTSTEMAAFTKGIAVKLEAATKVKPLTGRKASWVVVHHMRPERPMVDEPIIQTKSLTKAYGPHVALENLNINIPRGATGLLGQNGAGKSTFLKTILGLIQATSGKERYWATTSGTKALRFGSASATCRSTMRSTPTWTPSTRSDIRGNCLA